MALDSVGDVIEDATVLPSNGEVPTTVPTIACWIARRGDNDAIALEADCLMELNALRARSTIGDDDVDVDVAAAAGAGAASSSMAPLLPTPAAAPPPCAASLVSGRLLLICLVCIMMTKKSPIEPNDELILL